LIPPAGFEPAGPIGGHQDGQMGMSISCIIEEIAVALGGARSVEASPGRPVSII
jgi:hypothetical protein